MKTQKFKKFIPNQNHAFIGALALLSVTACGPSTVTGQKAGTVAKTPANVVPGPIHTSPEFAILGKWTTDCLANLGGHDELDEIAHVTIDMRKWTSTNFYYRDDQCTVVDHATPQLTYEDEIVSITPVDERTLKVQIQTSGGYSFQRERNIQIINQNQLIINGEVFNRLQ